MKRGVVFANNDYYHVYNRGIDRRATFTNKREYERALSLLEFYQYANIPLRYSRFIESDLKIQQGYLDKMKSSGKLVEVVSYCLMPNHFHLLLQQKQENGIPTYIANFTNAYSKYFNKKYQRIGALFQGVFKAVYVESEEQLIHLTRYIHLNPVASSLISSRELSTFPWSSYSNYISHTRSDIISANTLSMIHSLVQNYEFFVNDQISYAQELDRIKHMTFEHD